jgi:hypothetical protein
LRKKEDFQLGQFMKGKAEVAANEPQGYDLMAKSSKQGTKLRKQREELEQQLLKERDFEGNEYLLGTKFSKDVKPAPGYAIIASPRRDKITGSPKLTQRKMVDRNLNPKKLLKSDDLNDFKKRVATETFADLKKRGFRNPKTREYFTEKEVDKIIMDRAAERLSIAFKKLDKGGNPARQVIRQNPDIVDIYLRSGREISPVQLRPDQLVEYRKGLTRGIGRGRERGD